MILEAGAVMSDTALWLFYGFSFLFFAALYHIHKIHLCPQNKGRPVDPDWMLFALATWDYVAEARMQSALKKKECEKNAAAACDLRWKKKGAAARSAQE